MPRPRSELQESHLCNVVEESSGRGSSATTVPGYSVEKTFQPGDAEICVKVVGGFRPATTCQGLASSSLHNATRRRSPPDSLLTSADPRPAAAVRQRQSPGVRSTSQPPAGINLRWLQFSAWRSRAGAFMAVVVHRLGKFVAEMALYSLHQIAWSPAARLLNVAANVFDLRPVRGSWGR